MSKEYMRRRAKGTEKDPMIDEFLKRDLGEDIRRSGSGVMITRKPLQPTSILLSPGIIEKLKQKAEKRGIGYQTMLKIILHEHVDDY